MWLILFVNFAHFPLQKPSPAATALPWWPEFTTCRPASQPIGRTACAPTSKNAVSNYTNATPTPRVSTRQHRSIACVTAALRATVGIIASARKSDGRFFYYTSRRWFVRWLFLKFSQLSWPSPCAKIGHYLCHPVLSAYSISSVSLCLFMSLFTLSLHFFFHWTLLRLPEIYSLSDFAQILVFSRLWPQVIRDHLNLPFSINVSTGLMCASLQMVPLIRPALLLYFTLCFRDKSFVGIELMPICQLFTFSARNNCVGRCLDSIAILTWVVKCHVCTDRVLQLFLHVRPRQVFRPPDLPVSVSRRLDGRGLPDGLRLSQPQLVCHRCGSLWRVRPMDDGRSLWAVQAGELRWRDDH